MSRGAIESLLAVTSGSAVVMASGGRKEVSTLLYEITAALDALEQLRIATADYSPAQMANLLSADGRREGG